MESMHRKNEITKKNILSILAAAADMCMMITDETDSTLEHAVEASELIGEAADRLESEISGNGPYTLSGFDDEDL